MPRVYATSMASVCLSVCNIGGLWSHSATKVEMGTWQDRSMSWLPAGGSWLGSFPVIWNFSERVLHFIGNNLLVQRLACRAISASAELFCGAEAVACVSCGGFVSLNRCRRDCCPSWAPGSSIPVGPSIRRDRRRRWLTDQHRTLTGPSTNDSPIHEALTEVWRLTTAAPRSLSTCSHLVATNTVYSWYGPLSVCLTFLCFSWKIQNRQPNGAMFQRS